MTTDRWRRRGCSFCPGVGIKITIKIMIFGLVEINYSNSHLK